jgi:hypothetical protein
LSNISFSPETFVEIAAVLPMVCVCFFCNIVFVVVSFCIGFADDLMMERFVAAPVALNWVFCLFHWIGVMRALHLVLSHKRKPLGNARHNIAHPLQRQHL